ncbi:enoyl-CoA hydratase-related protein [Virgibacillus soli]|uniref:Enoyl-CoA hydratase-related protein n=1 Tax=Paracerasibacillus soli TaxID=480284 RepID=A0ABU5CTA7_9BACI|nr:enoyl-CoA hydratase-related protein [Virgibacillus soli]MDY0409609.1 enoyl-CoA hydratase-related protein [Virgibacillus soli]
MAYETIKLVEDEGIATIVLNRAKQYHAFTPTMNKEIIAMLQALDRDEMIRAIVITGSGKAFCAGEDLGGVDDQTDHGEFLRTRYHPMVRAMRHVHKPIIAAVNGVAAGAGMSLALAADFRIVQRGAKFVSAFMNIGLIPDSGFIYFLPRLVGYAKALEIATLGETISAEEALALGLATKVVTKEDWEQEVKKFATQLARVPTKAFSLTKRYMHDGMHLPMDIVLEHEAQAQRIAGQTEDHQEGMQAFIEKRQPHFKGK